MKLITDNALFKDELKKSFERYKHCHIAVAWVTKGEHLNLLKEKITDDENSMIQNLYVGLYGARGEKTTAIDFVKKFRKYKNVHFVRSNFPDDKPLLFHSKHYFFVSSDDDWCCYIGSANFTNRGLDEKGNFETMIKVSTDEDMQKPNRHQFYRYNINFFENLKSNKIIHVCSDKELDEYCATDE